MQWKSWEGKLLAGTYPLSTLLHAEENQAWFATQYRQKPATILVLQLAKEEADQRLANLEAVSRIKHPNLVSIERTGRTRLDGASLIFAVMETTEEDLASVVRERPLTPDETAEIIESLVAALAVLHEHGMLHGAIRAANVLASGETVKLRSDCACKLPPAARADPETCAQDVGDMGALIFEALTQRQLTSPDEPAIRKLPVPFRAIVQSAVTGRWGLADISAALKKKSVEPRHPIPATTTRQSTPKGNLPASRHALQAQSSAQDQANVIGNQHRTGNAGVRIIAVLAILIALALVWFHYRGTQASTQSSLVTAADPLLSSTPANPTPSTQSTPPADAPSPPPSTPASDAAEKHAIWRVVVYTFATEGEAQHKVQALLHSHPEFNPEVFTPNGVAPYLVTIGGQMTHERAKALRAEAASAGLPHDSYAQNYSH
jgi:serine/threonine protein kinase